MISEGAVADICDVRALRAERALFCRCRLPAPHSPTLPAPPLHVGILSEIRTRLGEYNMVKT
ncbi:hypothetical protein J6590_016950 [Homalodisca vitripennis]|nr:hypothetical protein J6590_016950 [Homalodisca vitripennis]